MTGLTRYNRETLERSAEMEPVQGSVEVAVPVDDLWQCFTRADLWPRWNECMFWALNRDLVVGDKLVWAFDPIRWWLPYKLPGIASLVEVERPVRTHGALGRRGRVTWEVRALPGFYARHTYWVEELGEGRSRFGTWEQAMGPSFRLLRPFWLAHFEFVKEQSLQGARRLEHIYKSRGRLDEQSLARSSPARLVREAAGWISSMRPTFVEIAPGIYAALGGGGNSLILADGNELLLVDPKLPPMANRVKQWIDAQIGRPVSHIVNTHFHYDHTWGNHLYAGTRIIAHRSATNIMRRRDGWWWRRHPEGMPTESALVDDSTRLKIGEQEVRVHYGGRGHTVTDLWLHLRCGDREVVVTGDVATLGVYPFFDLGEGGCDILHMAQRLRQWAEGYPSATFVPGHGPLATAAELRRHADYLEFLWQAVADARARGLSEEEVVRTINLSHFNLSIMPMFHYEHLALSGTSNLRAVFRLQERESHQVGG